MPDNAQAAAGWVRYGVDAGIVLLFLMRLPQFKPLYNERYFSDTNWLVECRVALRKFRTTMGVQSMLLTLIVLVAAQLFETGTQGGAARFLLMFLPIALAISTAVGLFSAFFCYQAASFWLMRSYAKAVLCIAAFSLIINGCLLR